MMSVRSFAGGGSAGLVSLAFWLVRWKTPIAVSPSVRE